MISCQSGRVFALLVWGDGGKDMTAMKISKAEVGFEADQATR